MATAHGNRNVSEPGAPEGRRRQVLILRSCRPAEFQAAVALTRRRNPGADIVALSHRGHRTTLLAAGVDRVEEVPGRRFGPFRLRPWTIRRLRRAAFDEVVVPQMTDHDFAHRNLYWVAALIAPARVVIAVEGRTATAYDLPAFRRRLRLLALGGMVDGRWLSPEVWPVADPIVFLMMLAWCCVMKRPRVPDAGTGRRRRVLHIISSLGAGGAQRQLAEVINRTPPGEYEVDLLVVVACDGEFSRAWIAREDVTVSYVKAWPCLTATVLEIAAFCRQGRYDLVHTWLFTANAVGVPGARLAGVPRVIASVRNMSLWKRTWCNQWWFRGADMLSSWAADAVTVNARALVADHARWAAYPRRWIDVIHNGLDPAAFLREAADVRGELRQLAGLPADAPVVGTTGRLAPEKDHRTFLAMMAEVHRRRPDVRGVIVGGGALRDELERAAADLGVTGIVTFLGERSDARRLMAGFDVFLLSSKIEGFPNVLLEAAYLGVPAVATQVGGNADVLPEPETTFPSGDAAAGARQVLRLLDDPSLAAAHADRTRRRALEHFTADRMADAWLALYQRCLAPARAAVPGEARAALAGRRGA